MSATGDFFIVDRRTWAGVCDQGLLAAVAYMVLACGTQRNNRDTNWSVNAMTNYAGVGVDRAKQGIKRLVSARYVEQTRAGTKPRYLLLSWFKIKNRRTEDARSKNPLSIVDGPVYEKVSRGSQPTTKRERKWCESLTQAGWLYKEGELYSAELTVDPDPASNMIWLPKSLVMGTTAGEPSPLARVRGYQSVDLLRLLVDLYHDQNLRDDSGISRKVLCQIFDRAQVGEQGIYRIFAFKPGSLSLQWTGAMAGLYTHGGEAVWKLLHNLQSEGLLTFIPHLCEGLDGDSEIIHPYGTRWERDGADDPENAIGQAAHIVGSMMANYQQRREHEEKGYHYLAPVRRNYPEAQLVGIARLLYRPHTRRTSAWCREINTSIPQHLEQYEKLRTSAERSAVLAARA